MYGRFAEIYDEFMDDLDPRAWAARYLSLAGGGPLDSICECGCGTGSLSIEWALMGKRVIGADLSEAMLAVAAGKARRRGARVDFIRQDIRRLALHRPVDAIFAPCDVINYLPTPEGVARFFDSAFAQLRGGGTLAFDASTRHKLERVLGGQVFYDDRDRATCVWHNRWDGARGELTLELTAFLKADGGLYERFDETHRLYARDDSAIRGALASAGFVDVRVCDEAADAPPEPCAERVYYAARKPAG